MDNRNTCYAHPGHELARHLREVAAKAKDFGRFFGGAEQAHLAGLLHDLGKAEDEFQKRIRGEKGKEEPHAHHGAVLALEKGPIWPVALAINGHHAGLHNRGDVDKRRAEFVGKARQAAERLRGDPNWDDQPWPLEKLGAPIPAWLSGLEFDVRMTSAGWLAVELYTRFLFSALIDADRLDTEESAESLKGLPPVLKRRNWSAFNADVLLDKLNEHIGKVRADNQSKTSTTVAIVRTEVAESCRRAAAEPQGVFTLTVPTGGGKTLASMLFALKHAKEHRSIRRIIVVIPYLNIIQQTAKIFHAAFGTSWVLEHHSQARDNKTDEKGAKKGDSDYYSPERSVRQLAAENWDAPIIVTTSVQFFDSLFSRRPSDARKLHNIAQSVIVFDECQTFPPRLMQPILNVLGELANSNRPYGCSLVFCTATQPALEQSEDLPCGLPKPTEINSQKHGHFQRLQRTTYPELEAAEEIPTRSWDEIAAELLRAPNQQGLVVVNTRQHARSLFNTVQNGAEDKTGVFHLSTWMTPVHRLAVLDEVRKRLSPETRQPCLLISTQCIEAGVDVDFPEVWRALGPYDAIVQAAGRCNRNGMLAHGDVHVFKPEKGELPQGLYQTATAQTELLRKQKLANPHDPESFGHYFRQLYQLSVPDECEIQEHRGQLHFEEVSSLFQFIEDHSFPVLVVDGIAGGRRFDTESKSRHDEARNRGFFLAEDWRTFQRDIVNLPFYKRDELIREGLIQRSLKDDDGLFWLQGEAGYRGGLNDFGVDFRPDYSERSIL